MPEQDLFKEFINNLQFDVSEYFDIELTSMQNEIINDATDILKENIVGDMKKLGGNFKRYSEKFENFLKEAETKLGEDKYKDSQKELKQLFKDYSKKLRKLIEKSCIAVIPVKELPWVDIIFRNIPRIEIEDKNITFQDAGIAFYGEIKSIVSRATIYGKMKDEEPLFAPLMGDLDLGGYELDEGEKGPKSQIYSYVSAVIDSLDSKTTKSQLAKYHEGYQRHGEPICDFLMNKKDLMEIMSKIISGLESGRIKSNIAVCGIVIPLIKDKTSLVIVVEDGEKNDSRRYIRCFEAILNFSAVCCEAPSPPEGLQISSQQPGVVRTPGGQELKEWTAEELAQDVQQRGGGTSPGMAVWTEEELQKASAERGTGVPEGMEVWTEEDLQELGRKRQGGLDIPEWKPEEELPKCPKCEYSLRKGWSECPICGVTIGAEPSSPAISPPGSETGETQETQEEKIDETEAKKTLESSEDDAEEDKLL